MKKIITLIALFFSIGLFAQDMEQRRAQADSEEMAVLKAKRMAMQLNLSEEQEIKLRSFFSRNIKERKELLEDRRENMSEEKAKINTERKELSVEQKAELQKILTAEQYAKWEALQEKRIKGRFDDQ